MHLIAKDSIDARAQTVSLICDQCRHHKMEVSVCGSSKFACTK